MKKNLKRNIAFLMATLMGFAAAPVEALAWGINTTGERNAARTENRALVASNPIPGLVHGNVPMVAEGTRFVSPGHLNTNFRSATNHYVAWRYLRLDFAQTGGVSPWGTFLQHPGAQEVGPTTPLVPVNIPNWSSARTTLLNSLNALIEGDYLFFATDPDSSDLINFLNTPAAAATIAAASLSPAQETALNSIAAIVPGAEIPGLLLAQGRAGAVEVFGAGHSIIAEFDYLIHGLNATTTATQVVNQVNALLATISALGGTTPLRNSLESLLEDIEDARDILNVGTTYANIVARLTALRTAVNATNNNETYLADPQDIAPGLWAPTRFVIPLNLTNGNWLNTQHFASQYRNREGNWLAYAAEHARFYGGLGNNLNSFPNSQLVSGINSSTVNPAGLANLISDVPAVHGGVYVNEFRRLNDTQATLIVTLSDPGVLYIPLPVQTTTSEGATVVSQHGGVAVLEVLRNPNENRPGVLDSRPNSDVRTLAVDRHVTLTAANGTIANAQGGNITNTTVQTQGAGRNSINFELRIAEVVTHHRFGVGPTGFDGTPEPGHTRGADGIAFELVAPAGFTWGNNFGTTEAQAGNIGISALHLAHNVDPVSTTHEFPAFSAGTATNAPNADQFFYIYRTPDGSILRFIERAVPVAAGGRYHVAGQRPGMNVNSTNQFGHHATERGAIVRAISGLPHNVLGHLQFNNLQLIHNNAAPAEQNVYVGIRNIPVNSVFIDAQGTGIAGGNQVISVPNPPGQAGNQGLPPGTGGGQWVANYHHRMWPPYQVISVHEQTAILAGRVGPHAVTLYGVGEVPTIIAGRLPLFGHPNIVNAVEWNQVRGREVRVLEEIPLSLWGEHNNVFEITEGVRIERVTFIRNNGGGGRSHPSTFADNLAVQYRTVYNTNLNTSVSQMNTRVNNSRLYVGNVGRGNNNQRLGYTMAIYINAPSNFQGPVYLYWTPSVTAAQGVENERQYVRIANVVRPVELESSFTNIVVGYQFVNVGNFTITENVAGALLQNEQLHISLSDFVMPLPDVIFDNTFDVHVTEGNVELSINRFVFDGRQHTMGLQPNTTLYVDRASTVPSTIEFTNVTVRSLNNTPLSNVGYDIVLWGRAIAPNFAHQYNTLPEHVRGFIYVNNTPLTNIVAPANDRTIRGVTTNALANRSLFDNQSLITELFVTLDGHATGAPIVNEVVTISGSGAVTIGGQPFNFDPNEFGAPHVNANGVAVLPARMALSILFGADPMDADLFVWDPLNSAFYVDPQGRNIRFQVNNSTMWVSGVARQILSGEGANAFATAAYVDIEQNSRLFVPLRAIAEVVGFTVSWNAATATVTLTPQ